MCFVISKSNYIHKTQFNEHRKKNLLNRPVGPAVDCVSIHVFNAKFELCDSLGEHIKYKNTKTIVNKFRAIQLLSAFTLPSIALSRWMQRQQKAGKTEFKT